MLEGLYAPNTPTLIGDLGVRHPATEQALRQTGEDWLAGGVDAVIVISPHFVTRRGFGLVAQAPLQQLYDFSGFPEEFYQVSYRPQGAKDVAVQLAALCAAEKIPAEVTEQWGLDHGAWSPLLHVFPQATVPVLPISICPELGAEAHESLGRIIRKLSRSRSLIVMATGSIIHRLDLWAPDARSLPDSARSYLAAARESFGGGQWQSLWNAPDAWRRAAAPEGGELPLHVLAGAFPSFQAQVLAEEEEFDAVSLTTVRFLDA